MKFKNIQHLYWRAGFGINPRELADLKNQNRNTVVAALFYNSSSFTPLKIDTSEFDDFIYGISKPSRSKLKELLKKSNEKSLEFNLAWIDRLIKPNELLRERMCLFWSNHFVCQDKNIIHIQQYNNTLRKYALGDFKEFLKAISKEASMIKYLNNKQNKKENPNENFARELLELFTLGAGNYSENDIKEAARAFTGWNNKINGAFKFNKHQHDYSEKEFLNNTGNLDGDDIVDLILKQKRCAIFICEKIYKYFVNDIIDKNHVNEMATIFYSNYDIKELMQFVFLSDWFYENKNIGSKIKSPIELIVGINKTVPVKFDNDKGVLYLQKLLGQILLRPPNVAGWQGGKKWIDSNTMMLRLKLPSILLNNAVIALDEKGDLNDSYELYYNKMAHRKKKLQTVPQWNTFYEQYEHTSMDDIKNFLIISEINQGTKQLLNQLKLDDKKDYCIQLMSLPEYQMC